MFLRLNVLVFLVLVLCGLSCSSNGNNIELNISDRFSVLTFTLSLDEFTRKRRIPYHLPGFWYHFLPKPLEGKTSDSLH